MTTTGRPAEVGGPTQPADSEVPLESDARPCPGPPNEPDEPGDDGHDLLRGPLRSERPLEVPAGHRDRRVDLGGSIVEVELLPFRPDDVLGSGQLCVELHGTVGDGALVAVHDLDGLGDLVGDRDRVVGQPAWPGP